MALSTKNPFLDALGGNTWERNGENTSLLDWSLTLRVFLDNDTSKGHSTGGAWTTGEQSAFWDALRTWESVANIRFVEATSATATDLIERKVTSVELPPDTP